MSGNPNIHDFEIVHMAQALQNSSPTACDTWLILIAYYSNLYVHGTSSQKKKKALSDLTLVSKHQASNIIAYVGDIAMTVVLAPIFLCCRSGHTN